MQETPISSFSKFLLGFVVFISMSIGLTLLIHTYVPLQEAQQQAAAAKAMMLERH